MTQLFTERLLREKAAKARRKAGLTKTASVILEDLRKAVQPDQQIDVFLSHRSSDADDVLGLRESFAELGFTTYVDWLDDPQLDRENVSPATAAMLRRRMNQCSALVYAFSEHAEHSVWMPWELGYSDARHGRAAVLPIKAGDAFATSYVAGVEFVGIYPYVRRGPNTNSEEKFWVYDPGGVNYVEFASWLKGRAPYKH